jgi:hypothetical protein
MIRSPIGLGTWDLVCFMYFVATAYRHMTRPPGQLSRQAVDRIYYFMSDRGALGVPLGPLSSVAHDMPHVQLTRCGGRTQKGRSYCDFR